MNERKAVNVIFVLSLKLAFLVYTYELYNLSLAPYLGWIQCICDI